MLSKLDELMIHQIHDSFSVVEDTDRKWFDRLYFGLYDPKGSMVVNMTLANYPNVSVMDGSCAMVRGNTQRNIRMSRRLHDDRDRNEVGLLSVRLIKPFEKWKIELADNEWGVSFSLNMLAGGPPLEYKKLSFFQVGGPELVQSHYTQICRYNGTFTVDGEAIPVRGWGGIRDRSWGNRLISTWGVGWWMHVRFPGRWLSVLALEDLPGGEHYLCDGAVIWDSGEVERFLELRHKFEVIPGTTEHISGEEVLVQQNGREIHMKSRAVARGPYMAGNGYGWFHGEPQEGEEWIEGEYWDLSEGLPTGPNTGAVVFVGLCCQLAEYTIGKEKALGWWEGGWLNPEYQYTPRW